MIRIHNGVLCIGSRIWAFTRRHVEDGGSTHYEDWTVTRQFVLHIWRLHLVLNWTL